MKHKFAIKFLSGLFLFSLCFPMLMAGNEQHTNCRLTDQEMKTQHFLKMKAERELLRELGQIEQEKAESTGTETHKLFKAEMEVREKLRKLQEGEPQRDQRRAPDLKAGLTKKDAHRASTMNGISGRVTDSAGKGIQNIMVYTSITWGPAYESEEWEVRTDAGGYYTILDMSTGTLDGVYFERNGQNYVSEAYPVEVKVVAGSITPYINAELATGGQISGRVTNSSGAGIEHVSVSPHVSPNGYNYWETMQTDANGNYTLSGLPAGNIRVSYGISSYEGNYLGEWYDKKSSYADAVPIPVISGGVTPNIDAQLAAGGQISGRVTNKAGVGIHDIEVDVHSQNGIWIWEWAYTDANGNYAITNLPSGRYTVTFDADYYTQPYCDEYYNDKDSRATADPVEVIAGNITSNIDAQMTPGGQISGRVTDISGNGIENIDITAYDLDNKWKGDAETDANGDYTVSRLRAGNLKIFFSNQQQQEFGSQWYNGKNRFSQADPVTVIDGNTTANVNVQLAASGRISGRITDAAGAGIEAVNISIHDLDGNLISDRLFSNASGNYVVGGLAAGDYKVEFHGYYNLYSPEWYNDKADFATADTVTVTAGGTTSGINVQLQTKPDSITVTSPNGGEVWKGNDRQQISWSTTGASDRFKVDYSIDNGSSWLPIAAVTENDGIFPWTVPNTPSTTCLVRVSAATGGIPSDISDSVFTILNGAFTISGAVVSSGSGLAGVVMNGLPGNPVTDSSGFYMAQVDAGWSGTVTPTNQFYTFSPASTAYAPVSSNQVTNYEVASTQNLVITSPAGSAIWEKGKTYPITWLKQGAQNANVKISLYKGTSTLVLALTAKTANDGSFNWLVPRSLATGSNYFIRVKTVDNLIKDDSDKFAIIVPAIKITSPTAGTIWAKGSAQTIVWTKTGTQDANVKIQLFKDTIKKLDITASTPNSGSFDWAIPAALINGTYTIRITTLDGKVKGTSKGFTIVKTAGLTLTSPNGNELMKPVETQSIHWTKDPDILEVKLEFSRDNGGTFTTIADHLPNTGSYDWLVPVNFTRNGIIRISDASGRLWLNDGLLEFSLKFIYRGEGEEPGAVLWFGGSDTKDPGYGFARIGIGARLVQFGGISKSIEPITGNWHELRVRFDFRCDTAEIKLDDQVLFENAPLNTTRDHYLQPNLALQAGGAAALDFAMDDVSITVVRLDDEGADKELFNVLADDFDRYDGQSNAVKTCWQWLNPADKTSRIELGPDGEAGKSLKLRTETGKKLQIRLPFSLPDKVPFDISDKCFNIEN